MIRVENISMSYGHVKAVDNLSFSVEKGEILGLLGPNGAGKSTTMKILTTYIVPSAGRATIGGVDISSDPIKVRSMIGYLPETAPLCLDMLTSDYLVFVAKARGVPAKSIQERVSWVVEVCGIRSVFKKTLIELSRGFKQRVGLAQALIHDPEVLILDEPTSGLDPIQIIGIRELIRSLARKKTIIFSTHILQEVTAISDRVVIINEGAIIADGKVSELEQKAMKINRSEVVVEAPREDVEKSLGAISSVKSMRLLKEEDGLVFFELRHEFDQPVWKAVDKVIKEKGWPLKSFNEKPISFEETFINLTEESKAASKRGVKNETI